MQVSCQGQDELDGVTLGIYWLQQEAERRGYDGALGRFTQPDSIVPTGTQGTQAWDRYAFVNNNPVRYNDPTGHMVDEGEGGGSWNGSAGSPDTLDTNDNSSSSGGGGDKPRHSHNASNNLSSQSDFSRKCWEDFDCMLLFVNIVINLIEIPVALAAIPVPGFFLPVLGALIVANIAISVVQAFRTEFDYRNGEISNERRWSSHGTSLIGWIPGFGLASGIGQWMNEWTPFH